ncbi:MAG: DUF4340 domain-containing protein [Spirochaetia bacterium]|nr:DUF4340 domain-containing protein [Spirochaetia bacterium]
MSFYKNRNLILLILCVFFFIFGFFKNDPFGLFEFTYQKAPRLIDINEKNIKMIHLKQGDKIQTTFQKDKDLWLVKNLADNSVYRGNSEKIENALVDLLAVKKYHDITSSENKHIEYAVAASDFHLVFISENEQVLADVYLGKSGAAMGSSLLRLSSEKTVYSAKGNFKGQWNQNIDAFRDKKIVNFVPENIKSIQFNGEKNYSIHRKENDMWELNTLGKIIDADKSKVINLLRIITDLQGNSFFPKEANPPKSFAKIQVELSSGYIEEIEINGPIAKNSTDYVTKSHYTGNWLMIPKYRVESLLSDASHYEPGQNDAPPPQGQRPQVAPRPPKKR